MSVGVQLTIQVQNVPALSGGVTCVFEDLSNAPGEVRAKGQVMCMSPSLRDLPAQTHSFGKKHTNSCFSEFRGHHLSLLSCRVLEI